MTKCDCGFFEGTEGDCVCNRRYVSNEINEVIKMVLNILRKPNPMCLFCKTKRTTHVKEENLFINQYLCEKCGALFSTEIR